MDNALYSYLNYFVAIGPVWLEDRKELGTGYVITNRDTGLIEAERNNLPESMIVCRRLAEMYRELSTKEDPTVPGPVENTPIPTPAPVSK